MPRLNALGQVSELRRDWFDNTRTVAQVCTNDHCSIQLSDGTLMADRAANVVVGGAGNWAAWLNREEGVFDMDNRSWPLAGLGPMGPQGEYAMKVLYFSYGPWDVVERDGSRWRLDDGDIGDIQLFGNRRGMWSLNGVLGTTPGLPLKHPNELVWGSRAVEVNGRFVLLYQRRADGSLVLDGHVIGPPADYFYIDLGFINGKYVVVWSPNQGDTDTQRLELTPEDLAAKPLVGEVAPLPVPPPPDPPPPTPQPEPEPAPMPESLAHLVVEVFNRRLGHLTRPATNDECVAVLNEVAFIAGGEWGLSKKPGGNHGIQPRTGIPVAYDILHHRASDTLWDVLGPSENATPKWSQAHPHNDPEGRPWVAPVEPLEAPEPQPEPEPEPSPSPTPEPSPEPSEPDYEALLTQIIARVAAAVSAAVKVEVDGLRQELDGLEFEGKHRLLGTMTFKRKQ